MDIADLSLQMINLLGQLVDALNHSHRDIFRWNKILAVAKTSPIFHSRMSSAFERAPTWHMYQVTYFPFTVALTFNDLMRGHTKGNMCDLLHAYVKWGLFQKLRKLRTFLNMEFGSGFDLRTVITWLRYCTITKAKLPSALFGLGFFPDQDCRPRTPQWGWCISTFLFKIKKTIVTVQFRSQHSTGTAQTELRKNWQNCLSFLHEST